MSRSLSISIATIAVLLLVLLLSQFRRVMRLVVMAMAVTIMTQMKFALSTIDGKLPKFDLPSELISG